MITYIPIVLVCASTISVADCKQGADQVITVQGEDQNTPMACLREGEEKLARTAFAPRLDNPIPYYYKVRCEARK